MYTCSDFADSESTFTHVQSIFVDPFYRIWDINELILSLIGWKSILFDKYYSCQQAGFAFRGFIPILSTVSLYYNYELLPPHSLLSTEVPVLQVRTDTDLYWAEETKVYRVFKEGNQRIFFETKPPCLLRRHPPFTGGHWHDLFLMRNPFHSHTRWGGIYSRMFS